MYLLWSEVHPRRSLFLQKTRHLLASCMIICRSRLNWMPKSKSMSLLHTYMDPNHAQISKIIAFLKSHHSAGQLPLSQHPELSLSNWPALPLPSVMVLKPHIPPSLPALDQDDYNSINLFWTEANSSDYVLMQAAMPTFLLRWYQLLCGPKFMEANNVVTTRYVQYSKISNPLFNATDSRSLTVILLPSIT